MLDPSEFYDEDEELEEEYEGPNDIYWAADYEEVEGEEVSAIVNNIRDRIKHYQDLIEQSAILPRIERNWRFYHGLYSQDREDWSSAIRHVGDTGEIAETDYNHFRSLMHQLLTITVQYRPALNCLATSTDTRSIVQSQLGDTILDYYLRVKKIENNLVSAVEDGLTFTRGYVLVEWDQDLGKEINEIEDEAGDLSFLYEGDIKISNPDFRDVTFDLTVERWDDHQWFIVRDYVNRWDMITKYPEFTDELKAIDSGAECEWDTFFTGRDTDLFVERIPRYKLFHKPTTALPYGRYVELIGDMKLEDNDFQYRYIPLFEMTAGRFQLTPWGYSPGFDLQGPQEALNGELNTILTNHGHMGLKRVWTRSDDNITYEELSTGLAHIQSMDKPEVLDFNSPNADLYKMSQELVQHMEYLSGINSVARGQPEASLKSGTALAIIESKAVQHANILMKNYTSLLESVGSCIIHHLQDFASDESPRLVAIVGKDRRHRLKEFTSNDISDIEEVLVEAGNAMTKTLAGRVELANQLLANGLMTTQEEFLTVIETGQVRAMTQGQSAELGLIRDENEGFLEGTAAIASATDNHGLHVREHKCVLDNTEVRADQALVANVQAHVMEHTNMLLDPGISLIQTILGYASEPLMPAPGGNGGSSPAPAPMDNPSTPPPGSPGQPNGGVAAQPPEAPRAPVL